MISFRKPLMKTGSKKIITKKNIKLKCAMVFTYSHAHTSQKKSTEKNPILMIRTPYSCGPYGEDKITPRLWLTYWKNYVKKII